MTLVLKVVLSHVKKELDKYFVKLRAYFISQDAVVLQMLVNSLIIKLWFYDWYLVFIYFFIFLIFIFYFI